MIFTINNTKNLSLSAKRGGGGYFTEHPLFSLQLTEMILIEIEFLNL